MSPAGLSCKTNVGCRYEDVSKEECKTVQDQECRLVKEPSCENREDQECRDVPSLKMENQCTTTQEEKCINTTSHKLVTQEKTLVERICSEVPDQECEIQTVVEDHPVNSTECKLEKENKCAIVTSRKKEKECRKLQQV